MNTNAIVQALTTIVAIIALGYFLHWGWAMLPR